MNTDDRIPLKSIDVEMTEKNGVKCAKFTYHAEDGTEIPDDYFIEDGAARGLDYFHRVRDIYLDQGYVRSFLEARLKKASAKK